MTDPSGIARCRLITRLFFAALCAGWLAGCTGQSTSVRRPGTSGGSQRAEQSSRFVEDARELRAQGREDEALALLTRAIESNPTLTVAHLEMGQIYEDQGDYMAAEESFGTAALQQPSSFDAQFGHGRMLHLLNRIAEAVRAYLRALAVRPDDFDANLALATAYLQVDGPSQALSYAQRAVQLNPASGPGRANLGSVLSALGRHREAVEQYQAAAELMELTGPLLMNLAESLGKIQRYNEMLNTLETARRIDPGAAVWERSGFALFKLKRYDEAIAAFQGAIEADPEYYPALNGLGVCMLNRYLLSGKSDGWAHDRAMSNLKQSLRINSRQPRIVELVARYER